MAIQKKDYVSSFTLIGRPVITDFTFKIDQRSEKSAWVYNSMNLGIDCGEKHGVVYAEMMGGYSEERENVIYVHGKDSNGNDDFDNRFEVAWEDRDNDAALKSIGKLCFYRVGLEKNVKGDTDYNYFLSQYDAIAYIKKHLTNDMVVNIRGNLKYSIYNDVVQVRKEITSIVLSGVEDPADYVGRFTQSILIDQDSASLSADNIDKDKGIMYVNARVLDYVKEYNGVEVRGQFPYRKQFEFAMDFADGAKCKKVFEKLFKVKKNVTQATFEGVFIEGGAVTQTSWDDVPDDIKELVECGVYEKEEALAKCASNGSRERRMVLTKPLIRMVGDDDNKVAAVQIFPDRFKEEDLFLDCMKKNDDAGSSFDDHIDDAYIDAAYADDDDMGWLNAL